MIGIDDSELTFSSRGPISRQGAWLMARFPAADLAAPTAIRRLLQPEACSRADAPLGFGQEQRQRQASASTRL